MKHKFKFTDIDCLVILCSLNYLIKDEERHQIDRKYATNIENKILETIKKDKESNNG